MGEKISHFLSKPIYPYIFGFFFIIYQTLLFPPSFNILLFILFCILFSLINRQLIAISNTKLLIRYGKLWVLFFWVICLFTTNIYYLLTSLAGMRYGRFRYFAVFIIVIIIFTSYLNLRLSEVHKNTLNRFLNVFLLILCFTNYVFAVQEYYYINERSIKIKKQKIVQGFSSKRDIVWILLDEYTSPKILNEEFNFKDPLVDSLTTKHFFVFDNLQSNSDNTIFSLASLFNYGELLRTDNIFYASSKLNHSDWVKDIKESGYKFNSFDFDSIGHATPVYSLKIHPSNYLDQILYTSSFYLIWNLFQKKNLDFDSYNQEVIKNYQIGIVKNSKVPTFTWVHLLIPHPPFYRNSIGIKVNSKGSTKQETKSKYVEYLCYGNAVVLSMINNIPDWKKKIIIISGDHGERSLFPYGDLRRNKTFAAIYDSSADIYKFSRIKLLQEIPSYIH